MVEETQNSAVQPKIRAARPKPVYLWTVADVLKWLKRHSPEEYAIYATNFTHHEITGRVLDRMTENTLIRLGVEDPKHRQEIWRGIMKLRLRTDSMEVMDLQRQNMTQVYYD